MSNYLSCNHQGTWTPKSSTTSLPMLSDQVVEALMPAMKPDSSVFTHGYVHGHVHHHKNHMHIHGHIHNHDHIQHDHSHTQLGGSVLQHSLDSCKQLNDLEDCGDIFCEELDDCFFHECDDLALSDRIGHGYDSCPDHGQINTSDSRSSESLAAPEGLDLLLSLNYLDADTSIEKNRYSGTLCELQKPKLNIFENLINNVHQDIEQQFSTHPTESTTSMHESIPKRIKLEHTDLPLHLHFPHQCHLKEQKESLSPDFHTVHQSCFHAKIPIASSSNTTNNLGTEATLHMGKSDQFDFDFFAQFNNFSRSLGNEIIHENGTDSSQILPYALPHLTFNCQWDSCAHLVDNSSLVDHVVDTHLKQESSLGDFDNKHPEFECEWDHCNFIDADLNVFLEHLRSHKIDTNVGLLPNPDVKPRSAGHDQQGLSPLLTPRSIEGISESPKSSHQIKQEENHGLNITKVKICPKSKPDSQRTDANFTCKWHMGKDSNGKPIICNATHNDEGSLQEHLQEVHIGRGRSIYHCCWDGCERNNGKPFLQRQKIFRHIHIHTGHKPCKCEICGSRFAVPSMLTQHMRIHSGEKPYKCDMCDKRFATSSSLAIHTRVHLGVKPLKCPWPGCDRHFRESTNLTKHMKTHRGYKCEICQQEFDKKRDYTKHCKIHDKKETRPEISV